MESERPANLYDEVHYPRGSQQLTHPAHVSAMARILGLNPPAVEHCRVLEIGCATGSNLVPIAETLPGSSCLGIDLSEGEIDAGQAAIAAAGPGNVRLERCDVRDFGKDRGEFDYIIAYGVYSWTPAEVRERLMAVCSANLAPNGIAYISYQVNPGYHNMRRFRDVMQFRTRAIEGIAERVAAARDVVDFLAEHTPEVQADLRAAYRTYRNQLEQRETDYFVHDEFADVNHPVYFHEFAGHAAQHGLAFLAEANISHSMLFGLTDEARERLLPMCRSAIEMEQYLDFLFDRGFRESLLVHEGATRGGGRPFEPGQLEGLFIASETRPKEAATVNGEAVCTFATPRGIEFATSDRVSKAAFDQLGSIYPRSMPFDDLLTAARARVYGDGPPAASVDEDRVELATSISMALSYSMALVRLRSCPDAFTVTVPERPLASPYARFCAEHGQSPLTTRLHDLARLNAQSRFVLSKMDGCRTLAELTAEVAAVAEPQGPGVLGRQVAEIIGECAKMALLVAEDGDQGSGPRTSTGIPSA